MSMAAPTKWEPSPPDTELFGDTVPPRFVRGLEGEGPDVPAARWEETKKWRNEAGIDAILDEPMPKFGVIKKFYKSGYYSYSKDGTVVYIEQPGQSNIGRLKQLGVTVEDYQRHYFFVTEACYRVLSPDPDAVTITIYDMKGMGITDFAGENLELFKSVSKYFQNHYVERSGMICIINTSLWFRMAMKIISPFIHPNTRRKMHILGSDYQKKLVELIGADSLPTTLGGTNTASLEESPLERLVAQHVDDVLREKGVEPLQVPES